MTSSYGGGFKPWMGVPGHGNMNVSPLVFDPLGSNNGGKPVDATLLRESWENFKNPKQAAPTGNTGIKFGPRSLAVVKKSPL